MKGGLCNLLAINLDDELKTYKRKVDCLTAVESDNLTVLKNAVIQPGKRQKSEVELWFANVKEKKSELQRIETEFREKGPSRNLKSRIEKETKEVEELTQQGKFPTGVVLDDHESTRIPMVATTLVGQSFTENVDSILKLLKEDSVFAIGVYGMGGVGKTTLMKQIHNRLLEDSGTAVYWVTASQDCSLEKLQNEIGKALGLDLSEKDKERKKALLFHRLSGMKKSVIILDDLWKHYLLEQVGVPLNSSSCNIVMTTRLKEVCCRMSCQKIIKIEPLCKNDAWKLFAKHLEEIPSNQLAEEMFQKKKKLAEEIVRECGGLPLALITMGCCARAYDTIDDWENALYELRRPVSRQEVMEEEVFRVLKFSFDSLKDQKVQNCFLCCALFPEDQTILKKYLVDLWIDAGLLDEVPSPQDKVSRGHAILNKLLSSCLLESTFFVDRVRMHDLVRDMAIIITQNDPPFLARSGEQQEEVPEEEQWSKGLVKVSLSHNKIEEIPNGMAPLTPELTVLMLNKNPLRGIPESFFMHMQALTVLDLSNTDIVRLPESVSDLANLRALLLARCHELTYVPSLAKLSNLRVLDLYDAINLEKAPDGIEKLKCLEKVSYWPWDISDSTGFNKLIQSLPSSISCYRFWLHDPKLFKTIQDLRRTIRDLRHNDLFYSGYEKEVWVAGAVIEDDETSYMLPATIEMVAMYKFDVNRRNLGDVFPTLGLATDLKKLSISWCPKIKVIFPLSDKQLFLPNLKYLEVSSCDALEEIFESNINNHHNSVLALLNLVRVRLHSLPKLRRIYMNLHLCTSLEELDVSHCPELEEIFDGDAGNGSSSSTSQEGAETLVIDSMSACIPRPNPVSALPKLKILKLEDLPKLGSIYKDLHLSTSLEVLQVMDCPKIERIFKAPELILALSKLKIISLERLPKLESICKDLHLCISLENLRVIKCPKIEGVAEEKLWRRDLVEVSLTSNTREIPNVMAPPTPVLTRLNLKGLTGIPESFFMHMRAITVLDLSQTDIVRLPESVSDLANLRELLLAECDKLTYVPSLAKLSNLEVLDLDYAEMLEKAPDGIEKLKCLKKVSYWPWDISDITGFNKLIQSLPSSLSCYRFWLHDPKSFKTIRDVKDADEADDYDYYIDDMFKVNEKGVWVAGAVIEDDETTYMLPATIETLDIYRCDVNRRYLLGDVFPYLTDLKNLNISYCNGLKYIWSLGPQQGSFIDAITLTSLPDLRGLTEFEGCSFSRLRCLYIQDCPKIKLIFPPSEKQLSLPNLFIVSIESCEELVEIFESEGRSSSLSSTLQGGTETLVVDPMNACISQPNPVSTLPKLKILELKDLPKLGSIYKDLHLCTSLEELEVDNCPKIERIFEAPQPILALPNLRELKLDSLTNLSCIHRGLLLCTSLEELTIKSCEELEEIFERDGRSSSSSSTLLGGTETLVVHPMNACIPQPNPVSTLPKLKILKLEDLPKLGSIYKDLHLCTSLKELEVANCPKIERIFEALQPILDLPNLRKLKLDSLTNLSSIHRGLLFCTSLDKFSVEGCLKLKKVPLSDHLICDDTPSSLLSIPSESDNPELWELLQRKCSEDARLLSDLIQHHVKLEEHNQNQLKLKRKRSDLEGENS